MKVFSKDNIDARLARFLLAYRKILMMSTGYSLVEILIDRKYLFGSDLL